MIYFCNPNTGSPGEPSPTQSPKPQYIHVHSLRRNLNTIWNHRLDVKDRLKKILYNLILALVASLLDLLDLELCILGGIVFGLLVATCVLCPKSASAIYHVTKSEESTLYVVEENAPQIRTS